MRTFKNKYLLPLVFLAAAFFLSISVGGQFLHERIHHHVSTQEGQDCPLFQLTLQSTLAIVFFVLAAVSYLPQVYFSNYEVLYSQSRFSCAIPRAPPVL